MKRPSDFEYPITFLPCKELSETREFYHGVLGMPIALDQGTCVIFKVGPKGAGAYLGFCSHHEEFLQPPSTICLTLVVETKHQVDEWHQYLTAKKVICTRDPQETPQYRIYNAFFEDPMGYTIEIQMFHDNGKPIA